MKKTMLVTGLLMALALTGAAFAADQTQPATVPASDFAQAYKAPQLDKMERPGRIFVNNREIEGFVTLELLVDETGKVEKAKVLYRTSQLAVHNAVDAASNWTFTPATLNGQPVKAYIAYNVPFGRDLDAFQESSYASTIVGQYSNLAQK